MILPHHGKLPVIDPSCFIAPSSDIIGEVTVGAESSVWFQVVIRGDVHTIDIGKRTNIQDHSCLHVTRVKSPLKVGDDVTVGHRVTLHGCTLEDRILVGMGAVLLDDCHIESDCIVGAGSLVTKGFRAPKGTLIMGSPAKVVRPLKPEELSFLTQSALNYVSDSREYLSIMAKHALSQSTL